MLSFTPLRPSPLRRLCKASARTEEPERYGPVLGMASAVLTPVAAWEL